jgi:hypothetical protein
VTAGRQRGQATVSLHIRRGDLLAEKGTLLSLSYYEEAIRRLGRENLFLVFSDDIEWCKEAELLRTLPHVVFVEVWLHLYLICIAYMYVCMYYVCMYVCIYVIIYTHIHTYIHTYI